jgi:CSLREA domain-containing protein
MNLFLRILLVLSLAGGCFFNMGSSSVSAGGTTYQVTKTEDTLDGVCDSDCSLRDAIAVTNAAGAGYISVPAGTYTLTLTGSSEDNNQTGDLDILANGVFRITGAGKDKTFIVGSGDRVFQFHPSLYEAELINLNISGGRAPAGQHGGGIESDRPLYLEHVTLNDNHAGNGAPVMIGNGKEAGSGGGLAIFSYALRAYYSDFTNNQAGKGSNGGQGGNGGIGGSGGAIYYVSTQSLEINSCYFDNNQAGAGGNGAADVFGTGDAGNGAPGGYGGALYLFALNKTAMVHNTLFSNNLAGKGGNGGPSYSGRYAGLGGTGGLGGAIYTSMIANIYQNDAFQNQAGEGGTGGNGSTSLCGIGGKGGNGGYLYAADTLSITISTIFNNYAGNAGAGGSSDSDYTCRGGLPGLGGGIYASDDIHADGTLILANHAGNGISGSGGGSGGGLVAGLGEFKNGAISYNTAGDGSNPSNLMGISGGDGGSGGGVFLSGTPGNTVKFLNTTIAYNEAGAGREGSAGFSSGSGGSGGGIYGGFVTAQIIYATIYHNSAGSSPDPTQHGKGGGLYNSSGTNLHRLSGSILAQNSSSETNPDCYGKVENTIGYNLIGVENSTGCTYTPLATDRVGSLGSPLNPQIDGPAGIYWYPPYTELWTPLPGSPALDAIPSGATLDGETCTEDQVGVSRPQGGACDIGAVERAVDTRGSTGVNMIYLFPNNDRAITLTVRNKSGYRMPGVPIQVFAPSNGPSLTFSTEEPPVNFVPGPISLTTNSNGQIKFYVRRNAEMGGYQLNIGGLSEPMTQSVVNYGLYNLALPNIIK